MNPFVFLAGVWVGINIGIHLAKPAPTDDLPPYMHLSPDTDRSAASLGEAGVMTVWCRDLDPNIGTDE
jgi:hypothetical protein